MVQAIKDGIDVRAAGCKLPVDFLIDLVQQRWREMPFRNSRLIRGNYHHEPKIVEQPHGSRNFGQDFKLLERERGVNDAMIAMVDQRIDNAVAIKEDCRSLFHFHPAFAAAALTLVSA